MGDFAAKRHPQHGRISACQFSVAIGIPFSLLILKVCSPDTITSWSCPRVRKCRAQSTQQERVFVCRDCLPMEMLRQSTCMRWFSSFSGA